LIQLYLCITIFQLLWTVVQNDDEEEEELESDDEVAAVRAQQRAAHFGWFDDLFVFDTGLLIFVSCKLYMLLYI